MANSIYEATGDGSTTDFTIPYTYLEANDVTAFVGGVSTSFTFTSNNVITFSTAPANGANVRVVRNTDVTGLNVTYSDGGALTAEQLNTSNKQLLFGVQEAIDTANEAMILDSDGKFQGQISSSNRVIKNVANPVNAQDAVTKNYLENTWLNPSDKTQLNSLNTTHLSTVATNVANVNTVASNISDVNAFAQVYRSGASDPTTSLDVGDLFYNTTSNLLKIWNGSSWETGVAGASGLLPLAGGTMTGSIAFSGSQTVDGRDVSTDGAKLDLIEAAADVTDAANVNPLVDAHLNTSTAASNQVLGWTGSDYDWVDNDSGAGDLLAANNLSDLTNTTTARTNLGVAIGSDVQAHSSVLDGTTASFTTAEESKLAGIEAGATADQTNAEIRAAVEAATDSNVFTDADHSKLNAIEANATADQTGAEIKAAYEAEANTNAFTDAEKTKLTGIEAGATADQTASEIRALVESATDSNVFTDADHTKLNGIEAGANVTDTTNVTAAGALMDSEVTNLAQVKAFDSSDYATAAQGTLATNALPKAGGTMSGDIDGNGNKVLFANVYSALSDLPNASTYHGMFAHVHATGKGYFAHGGNWIELANNSQIPAVGDGGLSEINFTSADHTKLNGIEANATADQTASEIRALVESATDSNVFTDADHTKLNNVSTTELYGENPSSATTPVAAGVNSVAIGDGASAGASSSVLDSLAIGTDAAANSSHGIAIGRNSVAGIASTAVGSKTNSAGSIGATATWFGVAVGNNAYASGFGATAVGYNAYSTNGANSFGEGYASGTNATSLGISTSSSSYGAQGHNSIAIGYASKATGSYGIAIGNRVWNTTANQISIGHGGGITGTPEKVQISESYTLPTADGTSGQVMTTDGSGTVSFTTISGGGGGSGGGADLYAANESSPTAQPSATGTNAIAIGDQAVSSGTDSFAIGTDTDATGSNSLAIGKGAQATANHNLAIGLNANATAERAIAIGNNGVIAGSTYSTAIGNNSSFGGSITTNGSGATALGGSYASGVDSFAAAIANNTSSYGALADNSVAIGYRARSAGTKSIAIGENTNVSAGSSSVVIGAGSVTTTNYAYALGYYCTSSGNHAFAAGGNTLAAKAHSVAMGSRSVANVRGKFAFASGRFATDGDAQGAMYILRADTTDATPTVLTTNNSVAGNDDQIIAENDTCIMFSGTLVAMQDGAQDQGGWEIKGLLKNDGGTTTLVSSNIQTFADGNGWTVGLTADNTNNALAITCTGEANHNIRWVANISTSEVTYA